MASVTLRNKRKIGGIGGFFLALILLPFVLLFLPFRGGTVKWGDRVIWEKAGRFK
jgi:hypothetical protein